MRIRPAIEDDIEAILALWLDGTSVVSLTDDPDGVRTLIGRDPEALLLAEEDGRLLGTLIAAWDGWRAAIYRLVVAPGARRNGVGSALVRRAEERFRALGARRVGANVIFEHAHAAAFWEAMGYRHDSSMGRYVRMLDEP
jgi:ribosomal protein S18 acetylase RimI-like enzyme